MCPTRMQFLLGARWQMALKIVNGGGFEGAFDLTSGESCCIRGGLGQTGSYSGRGLVRWFGRVCWRYHRCFGQDAAFYILSSGVYLLGLKNHRSRIAPLPGVEGQRDCFMCEYTGLSENCALECF